MRSGVRCGDAMWGCVRNLASSNLFLRSRVRFFFFFGNGLKVSLEMGSGLWGGTIWAGRSLAKVILDMGFGPCEECARALSLQAWFPEIV